LCTFESVTVMACRGDKGLCTFESVTVMACGGDKVCAHLSLSLLWRVVETIVCAHLSVSLFPPLAVPLRVGDMWMIIVFAVQGCVNGQPTKDVWMVIVLVQ
jgi:hypothetical protein